MLYKLYKVASKLEMASMLPPNSPESCVIKTKWLAKTKWVGGPEFKGNRKAEKTN